MFKCWLQNANQWMFLHREIEKNIDTVNNLRRDKYIIEGKLKKYVDQNFTVESSFITSRISV